MTHPCLDCGEDTDPELAGPHHLAGCRLYNRGALAVLAREVHGGWLTIDNPDGTATYVAMCHLCTKAKHATTAQHALVLLAFHYDRRHRGWTSPTTS